MSEYLYAPSSWGNEYHSRTENEVLGAGSAGPGKSLVLLMDPMQQVGVEHERCQDKTHPHHLEWGMSVGWALHLRRTTPMLDQTIARSKRFFPRIDPNARWNENTTTWTFDSGYKIQFGHCKDQDSWEMYQSNEYTHIAFDELVQFNEEQYDQITTRLRTTDPVLRKMLKTRAMSNPMLRRENMQNATINDPHWVRKRFVDRHPAGRRVFRKKLVRQDGTVEWRTRVYIPATLFDNPNKQFVADYEATLLNAKPHIRQALLYGNWYITEGSYYGDVWNERLHVCRPFRIPDSWPRWRSMDWGFKKPGCIHWYAMDEDGNVYVEREYTFKNKNATWVAKRVREIEEELDLWNGEKSSITGFADTQLWEKRGESGKSKAEEFAAEGVPWNGADKRSRQRNAERIYERLEDHDGGTRTPGLVFFEGCKMAIRTIPGIQTDPDEPDAPADGGEDHWHDSVGYGVAGASRGPAGVRKRKKRDPYDDAPSETREKRGRWGYGMFTK